MNATNRFRMNMAETLLLALLLAVVITTRGFCVSSNPTNESRSAPTETLGDERISPNLIQSHATSVKPKEDQSIQVNESLNSRIARLEDNLEQATEQISKRLDYQMKCSEQAMNSVNTSIAGATYALEIFSIVIAVFAVGLGIYIGVQVKNVANLTSENRSIHEIHLQIRDEVRKLDEKIKNNMTDLYNGLRNEETKTVVKRLCAVPEDIGNLFGVLASRELPNDLFVPFKEAYQSLSKDSPQYGQFEHDYLTLFFQHFPALALFDRDVGPQIEAAYPVTMDNSFENDITRYAREFLTVCVSDGILNHKDKIVKFFRSLSRSIHKNCSELHKEIYKTLSTKENRFATYSILKPEDNINELTLIYGQLIESDYKDASGNTESENLILNEIAKESGSKEKVEEKNESKETNSEGTAV